MGVIDEIRRNMKPCPLCGGRAELKISDQAGDTTMWHTIRCTKCGCSISHNDSGYSPSYAKDLIAFARKWNTRQESTQETYAGFTLEQLQEVAAALRSLNVDPTALAITWANFAAVVAAVQEATEKKWRAKLHDIIGKMEG